jgi:hypothetical protein
MKCEKQNDCPVADKKITDYAKELAKNQKENGITSDVFFNKQNCTCKEETND